VFVNLSDTGSLDKAVLEAMSCGVTIVTSNVAFKDILGRIDPVLYIHDSDPRELATKLKMLRKRDVQEIHALGRSLREVVVSNHDLRKLAKRLVYEILVNEGSPLVSNYK
jgi:glycosyltransferase involved in cell wall biosynthesis